MTCSEYEPLIALYVEGDLVDGDVERGVAQHLAECAGCREVLADLQASQALLKEFGSEAVDPAFLSAVRAGVLDRTERRRVWPWIAACAASVALVVVLVAPRKSAPVPVARTAQAVSVEPQRPLLDGRGSVAAPTPAAVKPRKRAHKRAAEPLVVKMFTDDPNIVVIWLVDQPGD